MKKLSYELNIKEESLVLKVEASKQDIKVLKEILHNDVFSKIKQGRLIRYFKAA